MIVINELDITVEAEYILDLKKNKLHDCLGCWSCWLKTPGRCALRDLDEFYEHFFQSEKVVFYLKPVCHFVSGNVKTLMDRLIVSALPYINYKTGASKHTPRYKRMPDIEIYYENNFSSSEQEKLFQEYLIYSYQQLGIKILKLEPIGGQR
ncbi:MAG: hypothetical protein RR585_06745 [Coprobacillus sp.]